MSKRTSCCDLVYIGENHNPIRDGVCQHCGQQELPIPPVSIDLSAYVDSEGILIHIQADKEVPKSWRRVPNLDQVGLRG